MGRYLAAILLAVCVWAVPVSAQEKGAVREGFTAESLQNQKILLMRPSVWVGEQSMAGLPEPNADWTAASRELLVAEMARRQSEFRNELIAEPELVGPDAKIFADYRSLFSTVARAVMTYQFFVGNRLPTKKKGAFDWTLGDGTKRLAEVAGARYALFVTTNDQYGSAGRKIFQIFAAVGGVGIQSGVHQGFAGLVDLETGHLVWLNADGQMGGDVRTEDGMQKRVSQLLEDFPGLEIEPAG